MFSPPLQPISSITSGTGSLITMWLDATESACRNPWNPAVALFTARTAASARTNFARIDGGPRSKSPRSGTGYPVPPVR